MDVAKVVKKVISTVKHSDYANLALLLVQPLSMDMKPKGDEVLCIDFVGADMGEIVLIMKEGSSVNDMLGFKESPADAAIVGVVDQIVLDDKYVFDKSNYTEA